MVKFNKARSGKKIAVFASVGALVSSGVIGCGGKATGQQDWIATEVATGRINLDAVKDALETSKDLNEFENRINEIYEGANLVLIRVEAKGTQKIISGFEDLNQSNAIEEAKDEKLFSITVEEEKYEVYGHSTNDYYYYGGDYSDDYDYDYYYDDDDNDSNDYDYGHYRLFMDWLRHAPHSTTDSMVYQANLARVAQMRLHRDNFRRSSAYTAQRNTNQAYFTRQRARHPQAFSARNKNVSSQRSTYQQRQLSRVEASRSARSPGSIRGGS